MVAEEKLLTSRDVATLLRVRPMTIWLMVRRGELPARRIGGRYRFDRAEVLAALPKVATKPERKVEK